MSSQQEFNHTKNSSQLYVHMSGLALDSDYNGFFSYQISALTKRKDVDNWSVTVITNCRFRSRYTSKIVALNE